MADYTSNTAEEIAGEVGFALVASRVYALAGVSRLTDVANDRQRPIVDVPLDCCSIRRAASNPAGTAT
jgi:hypothetical protein